MEARIREYENLVYKKVDEFRSNVIECMRWNGLEGRFLDRVVEGGYDYKIQRVIRSNSNITPLNFVKQLLNEELR